MSGLGVGCLLQALDGEMRTLGSQEPDLPQPKRDQRKCARHSDKGKKYPLSLAGKNLQKPADEDIHLPLLHGQLGDNDNDGGFTIE